MFTAQEKEFYASIAWAAAKLSDCDQKHGAVVVADPDRTDSENRAGRLFFGFNRRLTTGHESSAITEVIISANALHGCKKANPILFTTRFPSQADMGLVITGQFSAVYFFGEVDDPEAVRLVNDWNTSHNSLEMVRLEVK